MSSDSRRIIVTSSDSTCNRSIVDFWTINNKVTLSKWWWNSNHHLKLLKNRHHAEVEHEWGTEDRLLLVHSYRGGGLLAGRLQGPGWQARHDLDLHAPHDPGSLIISISNFFSALVGSKTFLCLTLLAASCWGPIQVYSAVSDTTVVGS